MFRVREQLRAGIEPKEAVRSALVRVGESITFSAATVIAALLTLLAATFQIYSQLAIPLAIGIGVMLLAGLTLLPALLAIFGRAAFWPSRTRAGTGKVGIWGRIAARIVRRPAVALITGVVIFGALASAVTLYQPAGFGGTLSAPAAPIRRPARPCWPSTSRPAAPTPPTSSTSSSSRPGTTRRRSPPVSRRIVQSGLFTGVTGPLNPVGAVSADPGPVRRAARGAGVARAAVAAADHPAQPPPGPGGRPTRCTARPRST